MAAIIAATSSSDGLPCTSIFMMRPFLRVSMSDERRPEQSGETHNIVGTTEERAAVDGEAGRERGTSRCNRLGTRLSA